MVRWVHTRWRWWEGGVLKPERRFPVEGARALNEERAQQQAKKASLILRA